MPRSSDPVDCAERPQRSSPLKRAGADHARDKIFSALDSLFSPETICPFLEMFSTTIPMLSQLTLEISSPFIILGYNFGGFKVRRDGEISNAGCT